MGEGFVACQLENSENVRALDRRIYVNCGIERNIHSNPELIYVQSGAMEVTVDGRDMTVLPGRFLMILPWQIHSFRPAGRCRAVVLVFSPFYVQGFLRAMTGCSGEEQVFSAEEEIGSLFLRYLGQGPFPDEFIISSILLGLCHCFLRQCPMKPRMSGRKTPDLYGMMYYISEHCGEKLTLQGVADAMGYSYYHMSHIFREGAGVSFSRFLNMTRVGRAMERLRSSSLSMTDIAFECGFASVRNFNRVFGEVMDMTPSEYRIRYSRQISGERISDIASLPGREEMRKDDENEV